MSWYVGLFTHPTKPSEQKRLKNLEPPEDPAKAQLRRDMMARGAAAGLLGKGRQGTLLTGQQGVAGQAEISVPSLLGR